MKEIRKIILSGKEVWPIIEGGKGIGVSNGDSSGAFAAADAVGTISGVCPPDYDENGRLVPFETKGKTRRARNIEVVKQGIEGSIREVRKAFEISRGKGRIHLNVLWGVAGAEEIIENVLKETKGMVHGITCGAGMPYRLAALAERFNVYYYPIVSSARAFSALWTRSFKDVPKLLGGVVYEDPWTAGGHNGLSNKENPLEPVDPLGRVIELRNTLRQFKLDETPVIMAGGVWNLSQFQNWIDNPEIGPIAFQLGTRPLLTKESPIPEQWKNKLLSLKKGDIVLNRFSSTGFYSSAINNGFLQELAERSEKQIPVKQIADDEFNYPIKKSNNNIVYIAEHHLKKALDWMKEGFSKIIETPDSTILFLTAERAKQIVKDQRDCKGCLVGCKFSSWSVDKLKNYTTGLLPDPRSFCILKTLQNAVCGNDAESELLFAGHNAYMFAADPLYKNGNIPTVKELIAKLLNGE
jgi:nitronate monooxygenase